MKTTGNSDARNAVESIISMSPYSGEQTAKMILSGVVGIAKSEGMSDEKIAESLMPAILHEQEKLNAANAASGTRMQRPYSMVATQKSAKEIREMITLMNNFLMCNELIFCDLEQKYALRILGMLEEKGLYRHQLKKYANMLRSVTDMLQMRTRDNDHMATLRSCSFVMPGERYGEQFHEEGGSIAVKLQLAFKRTFDVRLKLIRMDNKEIARKMNLKHPDLLSEIFTLLALAETSIELFAFCQKQIRLAGRGRLIDHTIKSTHHEAVRNAVRNLVDQFVNRSALMPEEETIRAREHMKEFQRDLVKDEAFELFNSQYMAARLEYIEYYLAAARMEIESGHVSRGLIREVWKRLGSRQATKSFFGQLSRIPIPHDEDTNTMDVAEAISAWDGKVKTVDTFRRLCAEGEYTEPPKETDDEFRGRVLRAVARKYKGQLPNDVLASLVRAHGTKKAVVEQLQKAGFELKPTLERVKKMKASELKQLKEVKC